MCPNFTYSQFCETAIKVQSRHLMTHFLHLWHMFNESFCSSFLARIVWKLHKSIKFPAANFPFWNGLSLHNSPQSRSHRIPSILAADVFGFYDIIMPNMMIWLPDLRKDEVAWWDTFLGHPRLCLALNNACRLIYCKLCPVLVLLFFIEKRIYMYSVCMYVNVY